MALRSPADRVEAFLENFGPVSGAPNRLLTAARGLYLTQNDLLALVEHSRALGQLLAALKPLSDDISDAGDTNVMWQQLHDAYRAGLIAAATRVRR